MHQKDPSLIFDEAHAVSYDERFAKLAPLRDALDLLIQAIFSSLPADSRVLCVGVGTGSEVISLGERFPGWRFTGVEPSAPMLGVCCRRIAEHGLSDRCDFHHGYVDSLPVAEPFDAATAILVSHFILAPEARAGFFRAIAKRLRPGGCLVDVDLASGDASPACRSLLNVWLRMMKGADVPAEEIEKLREAYGRDVALWPPEQVGATIAASGFEMPVPFFQAGLIHGWYANRRSDAAASPSSQASQP